MRNIVTFGDEFTFLLVPKACAYICRFKLCKMIHGHVLKMVLESHLHIGNELIGMYAKLGSMTDARHVFDKMSVRTYVLWNKMVSGHVLNFDCKVALEIFGRMESRVLEPDLVTWMSLISSYT